MGKTSTAFPKEIDLADVKKIWIESEGDLVFWEENIALAEEHDQKYISDALKWIKFKFQLRTIKKKILAFVPFV
jgi:hypothetical protein